MCVPLQGQPVDGRASSLARAKSEPSSTKAWFAAGWADGIAVHDEMRVESAMVVYDVVSVSC
jgi:hypothetical protein